MPGGENIEVLFIKYLNDQCSSEEVELLLKHFDARENQAVLRMLIEAALEEKADLPDENTGQHTDAVGLVYDRISKQIGGLQQQKKAVMLPGYKQKWVRMVAAAAVMMMVASGAYLYLKTVSEKIETGNNIIPEKDILPGGDKAILTLGDGSVIVLDSAKNGTLGEQGNSRILKLNAGQLVYNRAEKGNAAAKVFYNTLSTPRGGRYQLILPDGTEVWLNAESSITFPTAFTGKERTVTIQGEAYFEVKTLINEDEMEKVPFIVQVKKSFGKEAEIEVLGTQFNVNAYADETVMKTTLLEGAVRVFSGRSHAMLSPGQQLQSVNTGEMKLVKNVDINETVAWKNGRFEFNNMDLETIMRQVARWYDVEVVYEAKITDRYTVNVSRNVPVSSLFKFLEISGGVHFKIVGKKIIVTP